VRVGEAVIVAVFVRVVVGVKVPVCVPPVIGRRKEKNGSVGAAVDVGVKNIMANACWVIALSAEMGVEVYRGRRMSSRISGAPP
jgi:hypothetical protein